MARAVPGLDRHAGGVGGEPGHRIHGLRAYAGAPIRLSNGTVFGTLCGVDGCARAVTDESMAALTIIAREVAQVLERRLSASVG